MSRVVGEVAKGIAEYGSEGTARSPSGPAAREVNIGAGTGGSGKGAAFGGAADVVATAEDGALTMSELGVSDDLRVLSCSAMFCKIREVCRTYGRLRT